MGQDGFKRDTKRRSTLPIQSTIEPIIAHLASSILCRLVICKVGFVNYLHILVCSARNLKQTKTGMTLFSQQPYAVV